MADTPQYLRGNYPLEPPTIPAELGEDEADAHTAEFEKRCDEIQRTYSGLAGSVPYVEITRLPNGKFLWRGEVMERKE